ncbi:16S rRNA (guanine(966)-N(2))-methyltransferase RsmD [Citricoccus sp. SGAir0253]|uniref:16S rRNA (guanine(966)-N(2))-methyltransferase RsmD n=1 Tax=Citricoccus sp. SGAir0253 TaxID=2567881 RepID=UPI0010CD331B|nr:16S rRNA (guanine(966)-N(2))-methyltransferase RsmD [Citricoccus sp. SGAir0253]QCU78367.1 16S rRNA (guanine(966)-N(2))-methyltransferase RsmD [Citricoccus sp. SGAir0253]
MPRIIAGRAGGLQLASVPGDGTRPTTDRTREALFSWLATRGWLEGTAVADLFAGSGALGGEAASRGADRVLLVERDRRAAAVCRRNAAELNRRLGRPVVEVAAGAVDHVLAGGTGAGPWDLVLADPPYPLEGPALAATLGRIAAVLVPGGLLVLERSARSAEPDWPAGMEPLEWRDYGETRLYFCLRADEPEAAGAPGTVEAP